MTDDNDGYGSGDIGWIWNNKSKVRGGGRIY